MNFSDKDIYHNIKGKNKQRVLSGLNGNFFFDKLYKTDSEASVAATDYFSTSYVNFADDEG